MKGELNRLLNQFPSPGRVEWLGQRPERRGSVEAMQAVEFSVTEGLLGDHHGTGGGASPRVGGTGKRQVTLIQHEHLPVIASLAGRNAVSPEQLRRNVVVSGINLLALKSKRFELGTAILEGTGPCAPCSRMEESIGPGGYQAVRGHGGITARVVQAGMVRLGDRLTPITDSNQ